MTTLASISSQVLDLPPSCVAFNLRDRDLLIVGTYYLRPEKNEEGSSSIENSDSNKNAENDEPKSANRTGSLILCRLEDNDTISIISTTPAPAAILDLKWSPHDPSLLGVATSTGQLAFYHLSTTSQPTPTLTLLSIHPLSDPSTLIFYLTFHPLNPRVIGLTLSTGSVNLCIFASPPHLRSSNSNPPTLIELTSHSLEPWILAFLPSEESLISVLSGGDDGVLIHSQIALSSLHSFDGFPNEPHDETHDEPRVTLQDHRTHQAGITFLLPLPGPWSSLGDREGQLVVTGSYDDHIRLLRLPVSVPSRPTVLVEEDLGGGVWRVEVLSSSSSSESSSDEVEKKGSRGGEVMLLVSCMYVGARVVRLYWRDGGEGESGSEREWGFEVVGKFEEHKSMNYASAAQPVDKGQKVGERRVVSTSFYDRLMCVWRV